MLDREFKKKWINELLYGDYHQTHAQLGDTEGGRCCLGVACELMPNVTSSPGTTTHYTYETLLTYTYEQPTELFSSPRIETEELLLTPLMMAEIGLAYEDMKKLSELNDGGYSFKAIADYIEENL